MSAPLHYVDPTLQELKQLKQRVRSDKKMKRHISDQQDLADNAGEDLTVTWYKKYIKLFGQIDDHVKYIVPFPKPGRQFRFLDLGCCPGGFSTYVLKKNKLSTGVGVALDPAQGGHEYLIDQHLRDRYTIFFADMTRFNLSPFPIPNPYLAPLPTELVTREYDLIILDGHQLRNQNDAGGLLAISQIIIALMTTKPAGSTIVMKLTNSEIAETARIMFALDMLSSSLVAFKPYLMHREKATFYAVARGVGGGIERQGYLLHYLQHFQALWEMLMSRPNQQRLLRHDLDFIATDEELDSYAPRMDLLCGEVRARQRDALKSRFDALHNPT